MPEHGVIWVSVELDEDPVAGLPPLLRACKVQAIEDMNVPTRWNQDDDTRVLPVGDVQGVRLHWPVDAEPTFTLELLPTANHVNGEPDTLELEFTLYEFTPLGLRGVMRWPDWILDRKHELAYPKLRAALAGRYRPGGSLPQVTPGTTV